MDRTGVDLAADGSATEHLHDALVATATAFPHVFREVDIGGRSAFKAAYPEILPRFEAARVDAAERIEIAATLIGHAQRAVVWHGVDGVVPLRDEIAREAAPFELNERRFGAGHGLVPRVPTDQGMLSGAELVGWAEALTDRGSATPQVLEDVEWMVQHSGERGIDLTDRRIVVLGAAAELAPTLQWLEGGADVLWIDIQDPDPEALSSTELAGSLSWVEGGADLLAEPGRVRATIEAFADGRPVDLGLYAYAAGRAREWRLTATMNAVVDALPTDVVRGVAMLLSPTTCGVLTDAELAGESRRVAARPRWQRAFERAGALGRGGGHARHGSAATNRGIVSIQGGSYQAAQYVEKILQAESWALSARSIPVSANTAGISLTESIQHPVFETAFAGAGALGIETFMPATTAHLNGLLTLRDRLDPRPGPDLFSTRVHGGIYELPYPIEPALRVATAIGVGRDPRRLGALLKR